MNLYFKEDRPYVIIAPKERHQDYLLLKRNNPSLDMSLYTREDLFKLFGFHYDARAINYLLLKGLPYEIVNQVLEAFCSPFFNRTTSIKLLSLYSLREELIKDNLLMKTPFPEKSFAYKHVLIDSYFLTGTISELISSSCSNMMIDFVLPPQRAATLKPIYEFKNAYEEIHYLLNKIAEDLDSSFPIDKIFIAGTNDKALALLKDLSPLYGFEIEGETSHRLFDSPAFKKFLLLYEEKNFLEAFEETKKAYPNYDLTSFYNKFSPLTEAFTGKEKLLSLAKEVAKDISLSSPKKENVVHLLKGFLAPEGSHVYCINFAMKYYPIAYSDNTYFSDKEREEIGLETSFSKTVEGSKQLENLLLSENLKYLSYSLLFFNEDAQKSSLAYRLNLKSENPPPLTFEYSKKKGMYLLSSLLDKKYDYRENDERISTLKELSDPHFRTFNYQIKDKLPFWKGKTIYFSPTSLETFNSCHFQYLYNNLLKLSPNINTFSMWKGNVLHKALEDSISFPNKTYGELFENAKETALGKPDNINARDLFYLDRYKIYGEKGFKFFQEFESYLPDLTVKAEHQFCFRLEDSLYLRGKIDKSLFFKKNNTDYLIVIDYKTGKSGSFSKDLFLKYGLKSQLPLYATALTEETKNHLQIAGIFISHILSMDFNESDDTTLTSEDRKSLKLDGMFLNDYAFWNDIGTFGSTNHSDYIVSLSLKKDGTLSSTDKSFNEEEMDNYKEKVCSSCKEAKKMINEGSFLISPIFEGTKHNSCQYCVFKDVCFVKKSDFETLKNNDDDDSTEEESDEEA